MDLVIVRHGEAEREARDARDRRDPGLSPRGRQQASAAARLLAHESWDALYSSPQRRAHETAQVIAEQTGLEPQIDVGLCEIDARRTCRRHEDTSAAGRVAWENDFSAWGTTAEDVRDRGVSAFTEIVEAHPGQRVLAVSHGVMMNAYLGMLMGSPRVICHEPDYAGVSRVRASRSGVASLISLNETAHLHGALEVLDAREVCR